MCKTFTCVLSDDDATLSDMKTGAQSVMPRKSFDGMISRRQRGKLSTAARIAGAMYSHFDLTTLLEELGADPKDTPIVIYNRYANWDYVADSMCKDQRMTLDGVNNYVATAWFPATVQGYLTIENGNKGEAITIASKDRGLRAAAVDSLFKRDASGARQGVVLVGTFEAIPPKIGPISVDQARACAFGAFSLVTAESTEDQIETALDAHQELYSHVAI